MPDPMTPPLSGEEIVTLRQLVSDYERSLSPRPHLMENYAGDRRISGWFGNLSCCRQQLYSWFEERGNVTREIKSGRTRSYQAA